LKISKEFSESLFVLLFNFQGASAAALRDSFDIISPPISFVNTFLKVFQNIFDFLNRATFSRVDLHYTYYSLLCQ